MSNYRNTVVGIKGDGNVVGDNNRIALNIREKHVHHHREGADEDGHGEVIGLAAVVIVAIAASCYYFSRYSDTIYFSLEVLAWVETIAATVATVLFVYRGAYGVASKTAAAMICAFTAAVCVSTAAGRYHRELVEFALTSASFQTFWCGLSVFGKQMAFLHTLTASMLFAPATLMLAGPSIIPALFGACAVKVSSGVYMFIERLTSWVLVALSGAFIALAGYAHSNSGWNTWVSFIKAPPSWPLCPAQL